MSARPAKIESDCKSNKQDNGENVELTEMITVGEREFFGAVFPGYMVDSGQYERLGMGTDRQVPALVLFDSVTKQPMPIGYGILSQDEIMDRVFQLTQVAAGSDY